MYRVANKLSLCEQAWGESTRVRISQRLNQHRCKRAIKLST